MSEENFKIYSGKRCEEYYKKYNLVSAVHKIIDLEDIIKEVREYIETHKVMTQGHFDGEKWIYQYFELTCDTKELLEIL